MIILQCYVRVDYVMFTGCVVCMAVTELRCSLVLGLMLSGTDERVPKLQM